MTGIGRLAIGCKECGTLKDIMTPRFLKESGDNAAFSMKETSARYNGGQDRRFARGVPLYSPQFWLVNTYQGLVHIFVSMHSSAIMVSPKPARDLLITKRHHSFSPGFLETAYPELSPYAVSDHHGDKRSHPHAKTYRGISDPTESLSLSPASALDLVIATSGFFRDYVRKNV